MSWFKKSKAKEIIPLENIRLSIIGTPSAGKTFLVFSIDQLIRRHNFFRKYLHASELDRGHHKSTLHGDLRNSFYSGTPTIHSADSKNAFIEFEYHYKLTDYTQKDKNTVELHIRNIPGEMINTYFVNRPIHGTIDDLFNEFVARSKTICFDNTDNDIKSLLNKLKKGYPNEEIYVIERPYKMLYDEFMKYIGIKEEQAKEQSTEQTDTSPQNKNQSAFSDEPLIKNNFYSYLFFKTSTDILVCEDTSQYKQGISQTDDSVEKDSDDTEIIYSQKQFISTVFDNFSRWDDPEKPEERKRLYYAFTKFDSSIENPNVNYLNSHIDNLENDYWNFGLDFIKKVYSNQRGRVDVLQRRITSLQKQTFSFQSTSNNCLKHVFFASTNYDNIGNKFRYYPTRNQNKTNVEDVWDFDDYFQNCFPLGVPEFLISLLNRSGFQTSIICYFGGGEDEDEVKFNSILQIIK